MVRKSQENNEKLQKSGKNREFWKKSGKIKKKHQILSVQIYKIPIFKSVRGQHRLPGKYWRFPSIGKTID